MARPRFALLTIGIAVALALSGCAPTPAATPATPAPGDCAGVSVTVDFSTLGPEPIDTCVDVSANTPALDVLHAAGLTLEGTRDYGDAIVCRVNGTPAAATTIATQSGPISEDCGDMPSADAYWSVWVRQAGVWDYAQVGLSDLNLEPGQAVGLLFDLNNTAVAPTS